MTTREKQLDLIHDEIKKEHKKLESVRKQVDTELQIVQEKLDLLEKKSAEGEKTHQNATAELEEAKRVTLELSGMESKNLKQVAGIYDKMDADAAAQSIQQMVDKGKTRYCRDDSDLHARPASRQFAGHHFQSGRQHRHPALRPHARHEDPRRRSEVIPEGSRTRSGRREDAVSFDITASNGAVPTVRSLTSASFPNPAPAVSANCLILPFG